MRFYYVKADTLGSSPAPPPGMTSLAQNPQALLPPQITTLHESLAAWGRAGFSPGPIQPAAVWFGRSGELAFARTEMPSPLMRVGLAPDLAAWLVLLDKWMETFVVIARARSVWSLEELAGALGFANPAYLPPALLALPPDNWQRVAQALASAVADGPLQGEAQNRHWQEKL
jgi:hypothetical protein